MKIKKNEHNIPEPVDGIEVPSHKIEVVFVPLLAQQTINVWVQRFYDKFLAECSPATVKIDFFEAEELITDSYKDDIQVDYCITKYLQIQIITPNFTP
jgi:5-formyltetrahydrofolate cyclo-ligase